tara:strand:- start:14 stop:724 length:711 start_codon:yes stop_codon:yes gene_type:complete
VFEFSNFRKIYLRYIIKNNNDSKYYITPKYHFRHIDYDGKLISNILKNKIFKLNKLKEINIEDYSFYNSHNIVTNKNSFNNNYSNFANVCAYLIKYMLKSKYLSINVAIVVNNRNSTNFKYGNYITFGFFKIYNTMTYLEILKRYSSAVNNARNSEMKHFSLFDLYYLYNCDVVFNSWRELSQIENKNSLYLKRYETPILDKEYIKEFLLSKRKRKMVVFDYYDDKYIINKLDYLM